MKVLLTGGAGYVGGHVCAALVAAGHELHVLDSLERGCAARLKGVSWAQGALEDAAWLRYQMAQCAPEAVIHLAAYIDGEESLAHPTLYHAKNVGVTQQVLATMRACGVTRLVYASTLAVYGGFSPEVFSETALLAPLTPYAQSKCAAEQAIAASGIDAVLLRYGNVAGADSAPLAAAKLPRPHVIPRLLEHASCGREFVIYGDNFNTPDGTAVRDYVDVRDVATAHLCALECVIHTPGVHAVNIATGVGTSMHGLLAEMRRATGLPVLCRVGARRACDPAWLVACPEKAQTLLGWRAAYTLESTLRSVLDSQAAM